MDVFDLCLHGAPWVALIVTGALFVADAARATAGQ